MDSGTEQRLVQLAQGIYVERDALNIVEKIQDYDPNLYVQFLDPDKHTDLSDAPYRIIEKCPDGFDRVVFGVWTLDERVLERLYGADTQRIDVLLNVDRAQARQKEATKRRYEEKKAADADLVEHILRSPKTTYTFEKEGESGKELVKIEDRGNLL